MINKLRKQILFKAICIVITFTFLYQQLLWASDYTYGIPTSNDENKSGFMSAESLAESQKRQEELIKRLDDYLKWRLSSGYYDTEEWTLQQKTSGGETTSSQTQEATSTTTTTTQTTNVPNLSITTQAGDLLNYSQDKIDRVVQEDGTIIENITFTETGDISGAIIKYTDGTILVVESGKVKSSLTPDGTTTHYDSNGRIESQIAPDGLISYYTYEFDIDGNVTKTTVTRPDSIAEYDSSLTLKKVTKLDGTVIEYSSGIISKITKPDGSCYVFGRKEVLASDGTSELKVNLTQYIDSQGDIYNYEDDTLTSIELPDGSKVLNPTQDPNGTLKDATIQLKDGSSQLIKDGYLTKMTMPDGNILDYERDLNNTLSKIILTLSDGTMFHYTSSGDLIKKVNLDGTTFEYQNGLIADKIYPNATIATYIREYTIAQNPLRLTIKEPTLSVATYLYNEAGALVALGIDTILPATTPFNKPKSEMLPAQSYMLSTGVTTTDGTYLYIKRRGTNLGTDTFERIGTGFNGTIAGKNYGTVASSYNSYSATYHSDGYIYNPISSNAYKLEKVNVATGAKTQVDVSSGLIERSTGKVQTGISLITSDGRYIYNIAYHINNGSTTTYNGWTVKVFDPSLGFAHVRTFTTGTTSFLATGVLSDGKYLYLIPNTNTDSAQVTKISLETNSVSGAFTINQGTTTITSGQYDWINKKFWLGTTSRSDIYRYKIDEINYTPLSSINQDLAFKADSMLNSSGVLTTDGTYYYVKRWGTYTGTDTFQRIGTGLNGTIAGKNYGTINSSYTSYSATYYPDGNIYNPISSNAYKLEKINVTTGAKSQIDITSGLMNRSTGKVNTTGTSYILITSDGRYIYNVAYHIDNGSTTTYNGWTVKVLDPQNNWQVVKTYTVGTNSYYTNGIISDGVYLYFLEWTNTDSGRVTVSRISDGAIVKTYTVNQYQTSVINGQYDWVNNRIVLGSLYNNGIYTYNGLIQKTGLDSINTDGLFTSSEYANLSSNEVNPLVPVISMPDISSIESETQFKELAYTLDLKLKRALQYDGTLVNFKDGLVDTIIDKDGNLIDYAFDESSLGNILGFSIQKSGVDVAYDALGNVNKLKVEDLNISFANGEVSKIEKLDGTIIENPAFDSENRLVSATMIKPDGTRAIYRDGVIYEAISPGGDRFYYENERIARYTTVDGLEYRYTYDEQGNLARTDLEDSEKISTYDRNNNLIQAIIKPTQDEPEATTLIYENGEVKRIYKGIYEYFYEKDSQNNVITAIKDTTTGIVSHYLNERLLSSTDQDGRVTEYEYNEDGKVSRSLVKVNGKTLEVYTYTYTPEGLTVIEDPDGTRRTYGADNKIYVLEQDNKTYAYVYNTDESGREVATQKLTKIKDVDGTVTNYKDGKIESIIMPDGSVIRDLVMVDEIATGYTIEKEGNKYFIEGGYLTKEIKQDGTSIEYYSNGWVKSITSSNRETTNYDYEYSLENPLEAAYVIIERETLKYKYNRDGTLAEVIDSSGLRYFYDSLYRLTKVINTEGKEYNLTYDGNNGAINFSGEFKQNVLDGLRNLTKENIIFAKVDNNYQVTLNKNPILDFGNGSDGDLRVEAGQTLTIDGTKNYKSIYVAPDATLTVTASTGSNETIIKSLGTLTVDGKIISNGPFNIYASTITIGPGGLIAGNPVIRSHTINNSGMITSDMVWTGTISDESLRDGDWGTGYGTGGNNGYEGNSQTWSTTSNAEWATPATIKRLDYRVETNAGEQGASCGWSVSLYYNGSWHTVDSDSSSGTNVSSSSGQKTLYGTWEGVTKMSIYAYANGTRDVPNGGVSIFEMRAYLSDSNNVTVEYLNGTVGAVKPGSPNGVIHNLVDIPYNTPGTLTSNPTQMTATQFGNMIANVDMPIGTNIVFKTRTGASSNLNDGTWSGWMDATRTDSGYKINSPANSYIQYQVLLETTDTLKTPSISSLGEDLVTIAYSYNRSFDASVPPQDLLFKDRLTLAPSLATGPFQIANLKFDSTQADQLYRYVDFYEGSGKEVAGYTIEKDKDKYFVVGGVIAKRIKEDGTIVEYYQNGLAKTITSPDGKITNYEYGISLGVDGARENLELINNKNLQLNTTYVDSSPTLLLHLNDASIMDGSIYNHIVAFKGDAYLDTMNSKFGPSSLRLDGDKDYLSIPDSDEWHVGTGDATWDFWINPDATQTNSAPTIWSQVQDSNNYIAIRLSSGKPYVFFASNGQTMQLTASTAIASNAWTHVALVKQGSLWTFYVNGVSAGNATTTRTPANYSGDVTIGFDRYYTDRYFKGNIDEFRFSKGVVRYTTNFTPLDSEYYTYLYSNSGSLISNPIELNAIELNGVSWDEITPEGTDIMIQTRTGDSLNPDDGTWSVWSEPVRDESGFKITSPAAKYIQYKVNLTTNDLTKTPQLIGGIEISYVDQNEMAHTYIRAERDGVYQYDLTGKITKYIAKDGSIVNYTYDSPNTYTATVRKDGIVTKFDYENGLVKKVTYNDGRIATYVYDGTVLSYITVQKGGIPYTYSPDGDLTKVIDLLGHVYNVTYNDIQATMSMVGEKIAYSLDISKYKTRIISTPIEQEFILDDGTFSTSGNDSMSTLPSSTYWDYTFLNGSYTVSSGILTLNSIPFGDIFNYYSRKTVYLSTKYTIETKIRVVDIQNGHPYAATIQTGNGIHSYHIYLKNDGIEVPGLDGNAIKIYSDDMRQDFYTIRLVVQDDLNLAKIFIKKGNGIWQDLGQISPFQITQSLKHMQFGDMSNAPNANSNIQWDYFKYNNYDAIMPYSTEGRATSNIIEINSNQPSYITWNEIVPSGTDIVFQTRTGSRASYSSTYWSDWVDATEISNNNGTIVGKTNSTSNKYIQYRAVLKSQDGSNTPRLYPNADGSFFKLNYSYLKDFDANAPPSDLPFVNYLKFVSPNIPPNPTSIDASVLSSPITQPMTDSYTQDVTNRILPPDTIIRTESQTKTLLTEITLSDGTVIKYFNNKPILITRPDGTQIKNLIIERDNSSFDFDVTNHPDGVVLGYVDNKLVSLTNSALNLKIEDLIYGYDQYNRAIVTSAKITKDGIVYNYTHILPNPATDLSSIGIVDLDTFLKPYSVENLLFQGEYEAGNFVDGRLTNLTKKDGTKIQFKYPSHNTLLAKFTMIAPDGTITNHSLRTEADTTLIELVQKSFFPAFLDGIRKEEIKEVSLQTTKNNTKAFFIGDKLASSYDEEGKLSADYTYDENLDLVSIRMLSARLKFQEQVDLAYSNIAKTKADYLDAIAREKANYEQQLSDEASAIRAEIQKQREYLQPYLYQTVTRASQGCWGVEYYTETVEVPEVRSALNDLDSKERELNEAVSQRLAELNTEVAQAKAQLEADSAQAIADIQAQELIYKRDILEQEIKAVVLYQYRKALGRDPSKEDYDYWITKSLRPGDMDASFLDTKELKDGIATERNTRLAEINNIRTNITGLIEGYLTDPVKRQELLTHLGLSESDVVNLTQDDWNKIKSWLDSRGMHFGHSAFLALKSLLENNGKQAGFIDIATDVILIDILTGQINPSTEGDIELSMYALSKYAEAQGVTLYNTKLTFDDLLTQLQGVNAQGNPPEVIAHVNNNHYFIVKAIDALTGEVTVFEPNSGSNGETIKLSKEEFLKIWKGYTITARAPPDPAKIISQELSQRIKGAFDPFTWFIIILSITSTILSFIDNEVAQTIGRILGFITIALSAVNLLIHLPEIVASFATNLQNLANVFTQGISALGTFVTETFASFANFLPTIGKEGFSFANFALNTIIAIPYTLTINRALIDLGVNPVVANLITSFTSAVFTNPLNNVVASGLQALTITGINEIGKAIGIDPMISNIIGMAAGTIVGAGIGGIPQPDGTILKGLPAIAQSLKSIILPNVASELAYYGVQKLGNALGIDSRISYLAGIGIRSSLQAGLNGMNPQDMFRSVTNGLLGGITSIGLQWAYDELGVNPLLGAMTASAIAAGFEAVLNRQNVFLNVGKQFGEGIFAIFGDTGSDPWAQAVYISRIQDFTKLVQERGLLEALEVYATSIFHQQAINTIIKNGGILDMVTNRAEVFTDANGIQRKRLYDGYDHKSYIDINMADNTVLEKKESINGVDVITKQEYGRDSNGNLVVKGRTVEEIFSDNQKRVSTFDEKNNLKSMQIFDQDGNVAYKTLPMTGQSAVILKDGNIYTYILEDVKSGAKFYVENGEMKFTSLDVLGDDITPEPTYARDPNKTNLENAEAFLDSTFDDINLRFSGEELFGKSAWEVAMRSILLTSAKFQVTYGSEASDLLGSLTADENTSFMDYARLRIDSLFSPYDSYDIATADELAAWMALKSPSSQYGFSLTAIHGMTPHKDGWADNLNGVKVNGQNFVLTANSWNKDGTSDYIKGDGLTEYWQGGDKRRYIVDSVKNDIITGWQEAQTRGIPFDVAMHSLGTVAGYEAIRELKSEHPEIKIRNVYMMGSPLGFFIQNGKATYDSSAFANVTNVVNIYNRSDSMNILQSGVLGAASSNPLLKNIINEQFFGSRPVSGELSSLFSNMHDVSTTVSHGAMWKDPQILQIVEQNGVFTN